MNPPANKQASAPPEKALFHEMIHGIVKNPVDTHGKYVHTPFPQQLVIELTAACNQSCVNCGRTYMARPKGNMRRELFNRIVEEVGRESPYTEIWPAFMGEAMLLGDELFNRLDHARKVGCRKITLNTNGTWLNDKTIPRILEGNWDRLIVSCDAHTPETHRKVRPGRKTEGLVGIYRGVERLIELMRERNLKKPLIEMQFSIFDENEHEVEPFIPYWLARGVVVKTRPKVYWSGKVPGGEARETTGSDRQPCLWALDTACVIWNGSVIMCVIDSDAQYVAGSVEMQSLKEIWNGPLRWLRELQMQRRFSELPEVCRQCPDWQVKRANAHFPNDTVKADYEQYVRMGRVFMQSHGPLGS